MKKLKQEERELLLRRIRQPGQAADAIIADLIGQTSAAGQYPAFTQSVEVAISLLPDREHFLCGRFEGGRRYWCDVGFEPQVQAWGENMACAIAGAAIAYRLHPQVATQILRPTSSSSCVLH